MDLLSLHRCHSLTRIVGFVSEYCGGERFFLFCLFSLEISEHISGPLRFVFCDSDNLCP